MKSEYVVYVDESGDEGFKFLDGELGSSRWFILSAVVVRNSNDLDLVEVAKKARIILKKPSKYALHFRELRHEMRIPYVSLISEARIKAVNILIHKPSIKNLETFQQSPHKLYRYATRLLLERVSWLCRDHAKGNGSATDMIFSNRSSMSYNELREYLDRLFKLSIDEKVNIDWNVINSSRVRAVNHDQMAGLQIADAVASSIFFAANKTQYGQIEDRYLKILWKVLYRNKNRLDGYGMKFWCDDENEKIRLTNVVSP